MENEKKLKKTLSDLEIAQIKALLSPLFQADDEGMHPVNRPKMKIKIIDGELVKEEVAP